MYPGAFTSETSSNVSTGLAWVLPGTLLNRLGESLPHELCLPDSQAEVHHPLLFRGAPHPSLPFCILGTALGPHKVGVSENRFRDAQTSGPAPPRQAIHMIGSPHIAVLSLYTASILFLACSLMPTTWTFYGAHASCLLASQGRSFPPWVYFHALSTFVFPASTIQGEQLSRPLPWIDLYVSYVCLLRVSHVLMIPESLQ